MLPREVRAELVNPPGEILLRRTADGIVLSRADDTGQVQTGDDGLPVLRLGRRVDNDEVLAAIDAERSDR
ncbi:MAG: hypothetical protein L0H84_23925 [Pseudonocardia sp.]|nr:hypothetical protein [Pseudonocardia sp.]